MHALIKRGENGYRIGESHHRADLTDHEVELMRSLHAAGMRPSEIARKFDKSESYVSRVCRFLRRACR